MYSIRLSGILLKVIVFVVVLFTSGVALAAPENMETASTVPAILFLPITDSTGLKDQHDYMVKAINAKYAAKYPAEKFAIVPFQKYANQLNGKDNVGTEDNVIKAAVAVGANYVIRTDLQKVEIRRGIKGIFLKKWCSADIPVKVTIWDAASGKMVFDDVIKEKGQQESAMGLIMGSVFFVSEEATIKDGLKRIENRMDKELPLLQYF